MLGEDLNRFRNASKENYNFLRRFAWSGKVERLGFDEVFIDVTDVVDYNLEMMNPNALHSSFFHLSRHDPTAGFEFDSTSIAGHTVPTFSSISADPFWLEGFDGGSSVDVEHKNLYMRLLIGSRLAQHLRHQLEEHQGYTSTVGISTSKLVSKLVGDVNKPKGQTTLLPPYASVGAIEGNVIQFLDTLDIGKIPGIGFKSAQKIREHVLGRGAAFESGLVYGGTKENVTVREARLFPSMGVNLLKKLLGGPGVSKGIGSKVWNLINGVDDSEVTKEDSYISLLFRVREDLLHVDYDVEVSPEKASDEDGSKGALPTRQWLAYPRTLRLSTRPRPPLNADGTRSRTFNRISRSCDMPSLVLNLSLSIEELSERLVQEALIPLFHRLHPERSGWDLSLMNLCATNLSLTAASVEHGAGRDISKMLKRQEHVLKDWRVEDDTTNSAKTVEWEDSKKHNLNTDVFGSVPNVSTDLMTKGADNSHSVIDNGVDGEESWQSDEEVSNSDLVCSACGVSVPRFAIAAHDRFHDLPD
ncbi:MAG: hypothetical protein Q9170_001589 [Blastenia crenularia]